MSGRRRRLLVLLSALTALGFASAACAGSSTRMNSPAMQPTLELGDELVVAAGATPKVGDIVAFRPPDDDALVFFARVAAGPGDRIAVNDHQITLNGVVQPLSEPTPATATDETCRALPVVSRVEHLAGRAHRIFVSAQYPEAQADHAEVTVPADTWFLMGDHRTGALDSRRLGPVAKDRIVGVVTKVARSHDPCAEAPRRDRAGIVPQ